MQPEQFAGFSAPQALFPWDPQNLSIAFRGPSKIIQVFVLLTSETFFFFFDT